MAYVGCYSLHLYCDAENDEHGYFDFPDEYSGEFGAACRRDARRFGWYISRDYQITLCPKCNTAKNRKLFRKKA